MTSPLQDQHIVITGASGALGQAVVEAFLDRGATCHLPFVEDTPPSRLPWLDHERVHARASVNLGDEAAVTAFYGALPALWASVHLVGGFAMGAIEHTPLEEFRRMMQINAETCFLCSRESVRRMGAAGGRIVNVAARPVVQPVGGMVAYVASKAAVAAITQSLAMETADRDILINAVLPSIIDTPANRAAMPDADVDAWPKPAELAEHICFLASPANRLTSGALVPIYGRA
ncbi:SDR family NAD(P)-dependent oxidoreductase [Haliangium sp.]|uniref:SDR family NAD(P)-dependent oxidoreductase n=1 Tax=Haliangium sp. TaxID=2663208 RepID=UPI003D11D0D8